MFQQICLATVWQLIKAALYGWITAMKKTSADTVHFQNIQHKSSETPGHSELETGMTKVGWWIRLQHFVQSSSLSMWGEFIPLERHVQHDPQGKNGSPMCISYMLACYPTLVHTTHLTSCNCMDKMTTNQVSKLIGSVFQELPNICYEVQVFPMVCSYQNLTGMAVQPGNARTLFFPTRLDILNPASSEILNTLHSASI